MPKPVILAPAERPVPLNAGGFMITVLLSQADSGGAEMFHSLGLKAAAQGRTFTPGTRPSWCCKAR